ncbi:MAG: FtsQ-type POTRA domain-containing protein [Acidimicrobiia bacterium]|nr:FtsQ-type POTRA domain-containing protein [Acidimicrobiia bacterium]
MTTVTSRRGRGVDPRMQARRASVARREGLRRLWLVAGLTLVASLAIGAIGVAKSSWLDIEAVAVTGAQRADPQQIVTASGIEIGEPLVEIDLGRATGAVERVPWVAEATIDRAWNGSVTIVVVERVGIVAIPSGTRHVVIDRTGQQLELVPERPPGFLPVSGVEASGVPGQLVTDEAMSVVALVDGLTPAVAEATRAIAVADGQLVLELTVGGRANLGDLRDIDDKLAALETILVRVDLACLDVIDVRVPAAPTVRRTATTAPSEEPGDDLVGC